MSKKRKSRRTSRHRTKQRKIRFSEIDNLLHRDRELRRERRRRRREDFLKEKDEVIEDGRFDERVDPGKRKRIEKVANTMGFVGRIRSYQNEVAQHLYEYYVCKRRRERREILFRRGGVGSGKRPSKLMRRFTDDSNVRC